MKEPHEIEASQKSDRAVYVHLWYGPWVRVEKRMGLGVETLTFGCGETMGWVGGGSDQWGGRGGVGCKICSRTPPPPLLCAPAT
jgi:hypothetical protein